MLIVTKYEEIYPPLLKDFAYISENNCDAEMILEMEKKNLKNLGGGNRTILRLLQVL